MQQRRSVFSVNGPEFLLSQQMIMSSPSLTLTPSTKSMWIEIEICTIESVNDITRPS